MPRQSARNNLQEEAEAISWLTGRPVGHNK